MGPSTKSLYVIVVDRILEPESPHGGPRGGLNEGAVAVDLLDQAGETQEK